MTGFGKGTAESNNKKFTVEIKSLNSKQLDLSTRIPSSMREMELEMRNHIAGQILRGKIDLSVMAESKGSDADITINVDRAAALIAQMRDMGSRLGIKEPDDWYSILIRMPDIFHNDAPASVSDDDREALLIALDKALKGLIEFRAEEGRKLNEFFRLRLTRIADLLAEVPQFETERITRIRARMEDALANIPQVDYDRNRYEQEMIFYIEKLDITEEKQRLSQHIRYFLSILDAQPGQGKKLGFIAQEMGREINTLGSKSNHAEMQILVVKMKDELEQIKEKVLNVL